MESNLKEVQKEWHGSLRAYAIGFSASIVLTGLSFLLVMTHALSGLWLVGSLAFLAFLQATFQLIFFLHVGQEASPRWESVVFYFMLLILLIIVLGSLWIMYDLNDRVMLNMEITHD